MSISPLLRRLTRQAKHNLHIGETHNTAILLAELDCLSLPYPASLQRMLGDHYWTHSELQHHAKSASQNRRKVVYHTRALLDLQITSWGAS